MELCSLQQCNERNLFQGSQVLLYLSEWSIWPSSENWHLFGNLRGTHCDSQNLRDFPGQLFSVLESESLTSCLQVAMLNGWDGNLLPETDCRFIRFSHDEYFEFHVPKGDILMIQSALLNGNENA